MYSSGKKVMYVLEKDGKLELQFEGPGAAMPVEPTPAGAFQVWLKGERRFATLSFEASAGSIVSKLTFDGETYGRSDPDGNSAISFRIRPVRPIDDLRQEAVAASVPVESGQFRKPDLVELAPLDPTIHLDIRYATSNDFLGAPVYTQARAFLQRPAAEALVRAHKKLEQLGYGLLIHDGYRPWYVTKIFWDATPAEGKNFVADPAQGSRHNRGCAVDLTLYDLRSGKPIEMPGSYDEMSPRSYPKYAGGTSLQRWHRDLLRRAMESEGFAVYEFEWWHFDYQDWREYPVLNIPFEKLSPSAR
jgi:D-alanyl-D-alanine dipeptidase